MALEVTSPLRVQEEAKAETTAAKEAEEDTGVEVERVYVCSVSA